MPPPVPSGGSELEARVGAVRRAPKDEGSSTCFGGLKAGAIRQSARRGTKTRGDPDGSDRPGSGGLSKGSSSLEPFPLGDDTPLHRLVERQTLVEKEEIAVTAAGDLFGRLSVITILRNPDIYPFVLAAISYARKSIDVTQYSMDHSEVFSLFDLAMERYGVKIRILHDLDKYKSPACAQQNARLRGLATQAVELGKGNLVEFRTYKPPNGGFNSQHSKTVLLDDVFYLGGSANLTGQSARNVEIVIATRAADAVTSGKECFDYVWALGTEVSLEELQALPDRSASRGRSFGP